MGPVSSLLSISMDSQLNLVKINPTSHLSQIRVLQRRLELLLVDLLAATLSALRDRFRVGRVRRQRHPQSW